MPKKIRSRLATTFTLALLAGPLLAGIATSRAEVQSDPSSLEHSTGIDVMRPEQDVPTSLETIHETTVHDMTVHDMTDLDAATSQETESVTQDSIEWCNGTSSCLFLQSSCTGCFIQYGGDFDDLPTEGGCFAPCPY